MFIVIIGISIQPAPFELVFIQACFLVYDSCDPREIGGIIVDPSKSAKFASKTFAPSQFARKSSRDFYQMKCHHGRRIINHTCDK
jgi:hypothetical protein